MDENEVLTMAHSMQSARVHPGEVIRLQQKDIFDLDTYNEETSRMRHCSILDSPANNDNSPDEYIHPDSQSEENATQASGTSIEEILDLEDQLLSIICGYLAPCDAFSLCSTRKKFYEHRHNAPCLTKTLMELSLRNGLTKVLASAQIPKFNLDSFDELARSCPPSAVAISGGTTVKAIMGEDWPPSDIDLYTTLDHATTVRSWLIDNCHQVLTFYSKFYRNFSNESVLIVEKYTTMPADGTEIVYGASDESWTFKTSGIYKRSIPVHFDHLDHYNIETVEGGLTLPYEPQLQYRKGNDGSMTIDLVVADTGKSVTDVIDEFDLSICKNMYDGKSFQVFYPFETFARSSLIQRRPRCFTFITTYTKTLIKLCQKQHILTVTKDGVVVNLRFRGLDLFLPLYDGGATFSQSNANIVRAVVFDPDQTSMLRSEVIRSALCMIRHCGPFFNDFNEEYDLVHDSALRIHNTVIHRINRMIKYSSRGVNIEGIPKLHSDITRVLPEPDNDTDSDMDDLESDY